ncbi:MAG: Rpn family recombination-promoting nuclease/putative transposase [Ottowia sp.]|nr:Rpn family recombination-promoting nuclease/putative transposase [Ottowia sp.]
MPKKYRPQRKKPPRKQRQHDSAYKLMFSEAAMVRSLLQDLIAEDFVAELDLDTLERLPGEHIARGGQKRFSDIVWKVQRKDAAASPCYIAILLEFQSTPDTFMALRLLTYTTLLLEHLAKEPEVKESGLLPPVLPIVLYNGSQPWNCAQNVAELFAPMPEGLRPFAPHMRYFLLEERAMPPEALQRGGIAAQLVRLEQAGDQEAVQAAVGAFLAGLPEESREALTAAFTLLVTNSLERLGTPVSEHFDVRKEQPMLAETMERWRREALAEGKAEGKAEGRLAAVLKMLKKGLLPLEDIAEYGDMSVDEVRKLQAQMQAA